MKEDPIKSAFQALLFDDEAAEERCRSFLVQKGLLAEIPLCGCETGGNSHPLTKVPGKPYFWKCRRKSCPRHGSLVSERSGTIANSSVLLYAHFMMLAYKFLKGDTFSSVEAEGYVSGVTVTRMFDLFRRIISADIQEIRKKEKIGGEGETVEGDESMFSKRKNTRGRRLRGGGWVVGGVERGGRKRVRLSIVKHRDQETLEEFM
uniref:ISXO2-like transposase domain-containing protein n=1 Tax=Chromera velia CCMP2878 TaxID=1169474 RepID=A0A0G4I416_9ALVE|eukprot:Cvel_10740.t1-p1 / transcript=Cvel_10740.t1 / gene=Cvel_10740 / organism=Chromera_velia_CCMP2878 / gene_product=hypothetical protein / transcript_product=hypothetical protein / location=Cvel_scaffold654:75443-76054(+) / protein_length=204 / sequence_SO=supercontig / SO=protein_coding / is_pseudo=false